MLLIIIGIIFFVFAIIFYYNGTLADGFCVGGILVGIILFVFGMLLPLAGYEDAKLVEENELHVIYVQDNQEIYVIKANGNNCVISYTKSKEIHGIEQKEDCIEVKSAIVLEDENCTKAVIRRYVQKAKKTIWSLAITPNVYENIIVVPAGSVRE